MTLKVKRKCSRTVLAVVVGAWTVAFCLTVIYVNEISSILTNQGQHPKAITKPDVFAAAGEVTPKYPNIVENAPGELGKAVSVDEKLLSQTEKIRYYDGFKANAFNQYVSDQISVNRSLLDMRDPDCRNAVFNLGQLPDASVIITFYNEAWSTLIRTIHSVINRSPPGLLREVILVDDASTLEHLDKQLEEYLIKLRGPRIILVKSASHQGLVKARLLGVEKAKGKVLTFLDSHCEVTKGWLEPLLSRIMEDKRNVVTPVIDVIDDVTFEYTFDSTKEMTVGGFDWNLLYKWQPVSKREQIARKTATDPAQTPTMAGGLFAVDREYFEHIGSYDNEMEFWGGENLELSFRIWMCGGRLEILPCSRVGHVFRKRNPYASKAETLKLRRNLVRLAEVWMDDYKKYFYERIDYELGDFGDVSARKHLRDKLKCRSFRWYLNNINPEMFLPGQALFAGLISNKVAPQMCLTSAVHEPEINHHQILPESCGNSTITQKWYYSPISEIRRDDGCFDFSSENLSPNIFHCHGLRGNQNFEYLRKNGHIWHTGTNRCLELTRDGQNVVMEPCSSSNPYQSWLWSPNQLR